MWVHINYQAENKVTSPAPPPCRVDSGKYDQHVPDEYLFQTNIYWCVGGEGSVWGGEEEVWGEAFDLPISLCGTGGVQGPVKS